MDTFVTRVPDVQNLTTPVIELHWKIETISFLDVFYLHCSRKSNTTWIYFLFGILIYTH